MNQHDVIDLIHQTIEAYIRDADSDPGDIDTVDLAENIQITLTNKKIISIDD